MNKRLKLFEDFNSKEKLTKIVSSVFSDIVDDPKWEDYIEIEEDDDTLCIYLYFSSDNVTFDDYLNSTKEKYELLSRVNFCINHIIDYMEKEIDVDFKDDGETLCLSILEIDSSGEFWKKSGDGVYLKLKSLHKLLNLPNYITIDITNDGHGHKLEFKFKQIIYFNIDNLNVQLKDLKIEGEPLTTKRSFWNGGIEKDYHVHVAHGEYRIIFGLNRNLNLKFS